MQKLKDFIIKIFNNNYIIGLIFVSLGSFICYSIGYKDIRWDFTNYHYYNPFAFLYDRLNYDIVPSSVNTFFNPLIDLPLYFAIEKFNNTPNVVIALQGIWYGALLFIFYKFTMLFYDVKTIKGHILALLTVAIAATGQAVFFQSNSSTNEISISFFSFISLYFIFKMIKYPELQKNYKYFLCGLLLGLALGLKQTIIYICLSSGLNLIICYKYLSNPIKFILLFALGGFLGYLITNGWWMYKMWNLYQNPFFPFLNGIFKSPYFDDFNYSDRRFIPPLSKVLIFPYIWNSGKYRSSEIDFYDYRGSVFYTVAILFFIYMSLKTERWKEFYKRNRLCFFFTIFLLLGYVLWLNIFSIYRYIVIVEMLSSLFFVKVIFQYNPKSNTKFILYYSFILTICGILIFNAKVGNSWVANNLDKGFVYVETVKMPENTLLKLYNFPSAGVIPVLAKYNKFRALGYKHFNVKYMQGSDFVERGKFKEIRNKIEKEHKGPTIVIFRLLNFFSLSFDDAFLELMPHIEDKYCRSLKNNLDRSLFICVPKNLKDEILVDGGNDEESINPIEMKKEFDKMLTTLKNKR